MSHIYTLLFKLLKNCDRYLKPPYNITKISLTHNIEQFKKIIIKNSELKLHKTVSFISKEWQFYQLQW